jgi:hypothetical protein
MHNIRFVLLEQLGAVNFDVHHMSGKVCFAITAVSEDLATSEIHPATRMLTAAIIVNKNRPLKLYHQ